jgi:cysteine-rich repeat protein
VVGFLWLGACGGDDGANHLGDAPVDHDTPAGDVCGDGHMTGSEACDDGNTTDGDGCEHDCTLPSCGNHIMDPGEGCDDGNTTSNDGCSFDCVDERNEVEPNDDGTPNTGGGSGEDAPLVHRVIRHAAVGDAQEGNDFDAANSDMNDTFDAADGDIDILAALTPAGDEDGFALTNTTSADLAVTLNTWYRHTGYGAGVACDADSLVDTVINIRDADGNVIGQNDNRSATDYCSSIRWVIPAGGKIYAHIVEAADQNVISAYLLQVRYSAVVCGDGMADGHEQCDDGNTTSGDGCSSTCTVEGAIPEVEPNDTAGEADTSTVQLTGASVVTGTFSSATDMDIYRFTVATPKLYIFETLSATVPLQCTGLSTSMLLGQISPASGLLVNSVFETYNGIDGCSGVAVYLPAGTWYITLQGSAGSSYLLHILEPTSIGNEAEPADTTGFNDTPQSAETIFGTTVMPIDKWGAGDHTQYTDKDYFSVVVPPGMGLRAEIVEGNYYALLTTPTPMSPGSCEEDHLDSHLYVYDNQFNPLADNDDARGYCSFVDGTGPNPRTPELKNTSANPVTWYLDVESYSEMMSDDQEFDYRLVITVR